VDFPAQHHTIVAATMAERRQRFEAAARQNRLTAALVSPRGRPLLASLIAAVNKSIRANQRQHSANTGKSHYLPQYRASA
jgi:hypothetical protein